MILFFDPYSAIDSDVPDLFQQVQLIDLRAVVLNKVLPSRVLAGFLRP